MGVFDDIYFDEGYFDGPPPSAVTGSYYVHINAAQVELVKASLMIRQRVEERSTAQFVVYDTDETVYYSKGQPVEIYDQEGELVFGGVIYRPEERRIGDSILHYITCADYHYLADKRIAAKSYTDTLAGDIVEDLRSDYLAGEGIAAGTIQDGPDVISAIVNYVKVSEAYDAITEKANNFTWEIDKDRKLHFLDRSTNVAPWAITENYILKGTARLLRENPRYRNRQYIRGGKAITDTQTESRTADGDQQSFAMGFPLATVPSVTEDAGAPKDVGIKGLDTGKDYYWSKGDPVIVADTAPANGVALVFTYTGEFNIIALAEDEDAITDRQTTEGMGTGLVEELTEDIDINTIEAAFETANRKLEKYAVVGKRLKFSTYRSGLKPGQLATVTYSPFNLSATEMLIESVTIRAKGNWVQYSVVAVEGPVTGSWTRYFETLATGGLRTIRRMVAGEEITLIIMVATDEEMSWGEGVVETVYACPVPAVTLFPVAATLFPC